MHAEGIEEGSMIKIFDKDIEDGVKVSQPILTCLTGELLLINKQIW